MRSVILADDTRIDNISDSSSADAILAIRENYGEAGAVRDLFTAENSTSFKILDEKGEEVVVAGEVVLLDGAQLYPTEGGVIAQINFRPKTDVEILQDEVKELQDVVIEG